MGRFERPRTLKPPALPGDIYSFYPPSLWSSIDVPCDFFPAAKPSPVPDPSDPRPPSASTRHPTGGPVRPQLQERLKREKAALSDLTGAASLGTSKICFSQHGLS